MKIPFNRHPSISGGLERLQGVLDSALWSTTGPASVTAANLMSRDYGSFGALMTNSCTSALELASLALSVKPGDNVVIPSFAFAGCATAFARAGAQIRFADIELDGCITDRRVETLLDQRTKVVLTIHYGGGAHRPQDLAALCHSAKVALVEDCAHAFSATSQGIRLGTVGRFATFSFHDTKTITCGEGGALLINQPGDMARADMLYRVGTDQTEFLQGKSSSYNLVDVGGKFGMSEFQAALLVAQMEVYDQTQAKLESVWREYRMRLSPFAIDGRIVLPPDPGMDRHGAHIFFLLLPSVSSRDKTIRKLIERGIDCRAHYRPLHQSRYFADQGSLADCPNAAAFANRILRLPMHSQLTAAEIDYTIENVGKLIRAM